MHKRLVGIFSFLVALAVTAPSVANAQVYTPKGPIEAKYMQTGPWAVSETRTSEPCDSKGNACTIFYPTNLGSNPTKGINNGFAHPIIAWANGSDTKTEQYALLLRHWASWGFVVVSTDDGSTGFGDTVTDATQYLIAQGNTPGNLFYRKLDAARVGVSGHSQGGAAAIGLFARRPDLFKTSVPYAATAVALGILTKWTSPEELGKVTSGSIFYLGGGVDPVADPASNLIYYLSTANVDKALGVFTLAGHTNLSNATVCNTAECFAGRGYPTAWFMWKLQDAADGPAAFRAGSGEFSRLHLQWLISMSNAQ